MKLTLKHFIFKRWLIWILFGSIAVVLPHVAVTILTLGDGSISIDEEWSRVWDVWICHYNDVIMGATAYQITSPTIVYEPSIQTQIKESIKAPRHWPLWGEFTGDRWIPHTKGQYRGKCFHLMTSSCICHQISMMWFVIHFTKDWWADSWNLVKCKSSSNDQIGLQFCTYYDSKATAAWTKFRSNVIIICHVRAQNLDYELTNSVRNGSLVPGWKSLTRQDIYLICSTHIPLLSKQKVHEHILSNTLWTLTQLLTHTANLSVVQMR